MCTCPFPFTEAENMERLRRSFRRAGTRSRAKERTESTGEEERPRPPNLTRMQRIRQSLRRRKKHNLPPPEPADSNDEASGTAEARPPSRMGRLRQSFKRRRKKEGEKPSEWEDDEADVRRGKCSFNVLYLGSLEVQESRGMEVCEDTVKALKRSKDKKKPTKGVLHVSGDGLRVVDKHSRGMIVDQVIEKVSFCAPDRNYDKGFAYICRDGTTRRWLCHAFMAVTESGDRLSHAVGCAFAICLEKKKQREADCGVTMDYNAADGTFTRFGSFRQTTITERLQDPQNFKPATPPPVQQVENPHAVARPKAPDLMYQRQASFKGLGQLSGNSPFKRNQNYSSLRVNELPSNVQRLERSRREVSLIVEDPKEEEEEKRTGQQQADTPAGQEAFSDSFSSMTITPRSDQAGSPRPCPVVSNFRGG